MTVEERLAQLEQRVEYLEALNYQLEHELSVFMQQETGTVYDLVHDLWAVLPARPSTEVCE